MHAVPFFPLVAACAVAGMWLEATHAADRAHLTTMQLRNGFAYTEPLPIAAYAPAGGVVPARHRFEGLLTLEGTARVGGFREHVDRYDAAGLEDAPVKHLPGFSFELRQVDDSLVPLRRGAVPGDHSYWEWILEPGRVWQEAGDGDFSRAALPFSLREVNANCTHNGVLTFLYRQGGEVSNVAYQVSSETCAYFKVDLWGSVAARYQPYKVSDSAAIALAYRQEVAARLTRKPIAALADDFPGVDPASFGHGDDVSAGHITTWGVVVDGMHYAGDCPTRAGAHPFCEVLDLPSYSLAKSVFAAAVLMHLEKMYPGTRSLPVKDYVPECAASGKWSGVSFQHLLDMASGLYLSAVEHADENAPHGDEGFFRPTSHRQKIDYACNFFPRREDPGQRWVYRTSDTYILGTALNSYIRRHRGSDVDIFDDVLVAEVWGSLRLSPATRVTMRARKDVEQAGTGQPFTGFGLTLQPDDVAKLGQFFNPRNDAAARVLDPGMRRAALQLDADNRGLPAARDGSLRYSNGFWALRVADLPGCRGDQYVPFMSGYGGITILLLPNGVTYYYFSDNDEYRFRRVIDEAAVIRGYCQPDATSDTSQAKARSR